MLLLDRNNEPTSTVYYLAASAYGYLKGHAGTDASNLYEHINHVAGKKVNYDFYLMALDFLYLMGCVDVDGKGGMHVHKKAQNS